MAELPHIGKHCSVESCKQLDFLPFDCNGCGKTFCTKQRMTTSVMSHRHQQDHQCTHLRTAVVPNIQTAQHVADILSRRQSSTPEKPLKSLKARQTAARVALMKLKGKATGDKRIPDTERIFFSVALPLASKLAPKALFFSKKWTVGKVIDFIADSASLHNPNNLAEAKKLRLFGDSGDILPVEGSMETVMTDVYGVFNGSTLILESVSPDVICLPNMVNYTTTL